MLTWVLLESYFSLTWVLLESYLSLTWLLGVSLSQPALGWPFCFSLKVQLWKNTPKRLTNFKQCLHSALKLYACICIDVHAYAYILVHSMYSMHNISHIRLTETALGNDKNNVWAAPVRADQGLGHPASHQEHNNKRHKNKHSPHIHFFTKSVWACFQFISFRLFGLRSRFTWGSLEAHLRLTWDSLETHLVFWHFWGSRDDPKTRQKNIEKTKGANWGSKIKNKRPEPQSDSAGAVQTLVATFYKKLKISLKMLPAGLPFSVTFSTFLKVFS